ncbi:MAG: hypothetical protein PHU51_04955 [Candidatus Nanoarchaeia archaeon]|nr:hypothetical protein [Candidatus Nanoarchaeia archaeon]
MSDISTVIAILGCALSITGFYIGRVTAHKTEGKESGSLAKDIEYIKDSVERIETRLNDDVKRLEGRCDEMSKQMVTISGNASKAYESAKMEHNRLNEHLERDHGQTVVRTRGLSND